MRGEKARGFQDDGANQGDQVSGVLGMRMAGRILRLNGKMYGGCPLGDVVDGSPNSRIQGDSESKEKY